MTVILCVSFHKSGEWLGFDTYYLDHRGDHAGAFLNRSVAA